MTATIIASDSIWELNADARTICRITDTSPPTAQVQADGLVQPYERLFIEHETEGRLLIDEPVPGQELDVAGRAPSRPGSALWSPRCTALRPWCGADRSRSSNPSPKSPAVRDGRRPSRPHVPHAGRRTRHRSASDRWRQATGNAASSAIGLWQASDETEHRTWSAFDSEPVLAEPIDGWRRSWSTPPGHQA